jgi:hypothetical protein
MNRRALGRWLPYVVLLLFLAAGAFVAGNLLTEGAHAQAPASVAAAPDLPLTPDGGASCSIQEIASLDIRMHVKCAPNIGGIGPSIVYFALPTVTATDVRMANRFLATLMTAWAFGRMPTVYWSDNPVDNPSGCLSANCRKLLGVVLQ